MPVPLISRTRPIFHLSLFFTNIIIICTLIFGS